MAKEMQIPYEGELLIQPDMALFEQKAPESFTSKADLVVDLHEPGKSLYLFFSPKYRCITARIANIEGEQSTPGATTRLYREALPLMISMATNTNTPWTYQFFTRNQSMREWALDPSKGGAIFDWDEIEDSPERGLVALKIINPSHKKID